MSLIKKTILLSSVTIFIGYCAIGIFYYLISPSTSDTNLISKKEIGELLIIALLLSVILSSLIAIFLYFKIFSKITDVENRINYIAESDDYNVEITVEGKDELSKFAAQVNRMIRIKNITDKALRESEYLYKSILEASEDAFVIINKEAKVIFANKKFENLFGYQFDEIENKPLFEITCNNIENCLWKNLIGENWNKSVGPQFVKLENKFQQELDLDVFASPIMLKEKLFLLVRITDITSIKKLELQMQEYQLQLQQADKLASLGLLVAGVAHEINNPNSFISFNLAYIENTFEELIPILDNYALENPSFKIGNLDYSKFKTDLKDLISDLKEGSNRITAIVNELKNFARIDQPSEVKYFKIDDIFQSALRLLNYQITKKNITINYIPPQNIFLLGNSLKLGQVIINVIANSLDAIDNVNGTITIKSYFDKENNLLFEIADNGCGISPEKIKMVFNPFYTTKSGSGGTGLGLSVSKDLMHNMGFSIDINSEINKGTTVVLFFPKEYVKCEKFQS